MIDLFLPIAVGKAKRIGDGAMVPHVVGYDPDAKQPVIHMGTGKFTLSQVQRAAWERGEEAFTREELDQINKAVEPIVQVLNRNTQ